MDLSEKYIKMCWKAAELQKRWTPRVGDYVFAEGIYEVSIITNISQDKMVEGVCIKLWGKEIETWKVKEIVGDIECVKKHRTWLPRQDQIQEFFDPKIESSVDVGAYCLTLVNFLKKFKDIFWAESAEQAWLALWMWDEHNKICTIRRRRGYRLRK